MAPLRKSVLFLLDDLERRWIQLQIVGLAVLGFSAFHFPRFVVEFDITPIGEALADKGFLNTGLLLRGWIPVGPGWPDKGNRNDNPESKRCDLHLEISLVVYSSRKNPGRRSKVPSEATLNPLD